MSRTLGDIAKRLDGRLDGDPSLMVHGLAGLAEARPGELSFVGADRFLPLAARTRATALIVDGKFPSATVSLVRVDAPASAFESLVDWFRPDASVIEPGVDARASVDPSASLGARVAVLAHASVAAHAQIGAGTVLHPGVRVGAHVRIGRDCILHPNVVLRDRVTLGDRVVIHGGSVIGADGFGYRPGKAGLEKLEHVGTVEIGDDVEIGACVTIDRARFARTSIGRGTKIDNLVQIAHNVQIGEHCVIAAQAGLSGSSTVGDGTMFGGGAATADHVHVGKRVMAMARSGISKDVPDGAMIFGYVAGPQKTKRREEAAIRFLPELLKRVRELEKKLGLADSETNTEGG